MFEINLVPDVKAEMIQAQKKRNVVFFAAAVVSAIAAGLVVLLMGVKFGQDLKLKTQDDKLELMSNTIEKYDGLDELLTVQKQLSDLQTISENKKMLSRVFTVLHSLLEQENDDEVKISSLDVNMLTSDLTFDGQADAGATTDGIDYRVLESFKKSIGLMKYDYGRYVDKNGEEIPTMCIFESGTSGAPYRDSNGNVYAIWAKSVEGCDPSAVTQESTDETGLGTETVDAVQIQNVDLSQPADGVNLVKIFRTPQFSEWYRKGYMDTSGAISKIEHFESQCITYSGNESGSTVSWNSTNICDMSPDGIEINSSSNGKQAGGKLVLMFSAVLHVNPEVFNFNNKHMITITPSGRQNVTDSFMQVGDMFTERAKAVETSN
ncbi:hypothetical protein IJG98_01955 [Candidatus Saccharibacteria bacterium]|nr:hypothetical protein [Candidatus Saccharibacteria bacterium]